MKQNTRRHWSIFLGIWSLPLVGMLPLSWFIFERTFHLFGGPDKTRPDIYLEYLEADLMKVAIAGFFVVALVQTFLGGARTARSIWGPHLLVWLALALGWGGLHIVKPPPPPTLKQLAGDTFAIPQVFRPNATYQYIPSQKRSIPIFGFRVCQDTVTPAFGADCTGTLVQVNEDPDVGTAFSGLAAETGYRAYLAKSGVTTDGGLAEVIDQAGSLRVVKMARGAANADAWVTLDAADTIQRFASCGWRDGCLVAFESRFGHVAYRTSPDAAQSLEARESHEAALLALIESWRR